MASKEVEVLDPAPTVEKLTKAASERVLNRRHFIAALGVAGAAAAGTELVRMGPTALAQQPKPSGYAQVDVLNFLLNIKYLKATLYSFITQGVDLPVASFTNLGSGGVFNPPKQVVFTAGGSASASEITDLFNEMYYDELNQLIALRALIGAAAVLPRPTMNLAGTGSTTTTATVTVTPVQAIAILRMLEDLSASAFAGSTIYLTGTNLSYATQALAVDGFHAGALRLVAIQTGAPYYGPQSLTTTSAGVQTQNAFTGSLVTGSNTVFNFAPTNPITVGSILTGPGIPNDTTVTAVNPPTVYTGTLTGTATAPNDVITNVTPTTGLVVGQAISGSGVPANSIITNITGSTVTIGVITGYSSLTPPTPITNSVLSIAGVGGAGTGGVGMTVATVPLVFTGGGGGSGAAGTLTVLTPGTLTTPGTFTVNLTANGQGYNTPPTVTAATGGTPPSLIASLPGQITTSTATVTLTPGFTAATTKSGATLIYVSQTAGLIPGQIITGTNLPANVTIAQGGINAATGVITMQTGGNPPAATSASATSSVAPTGVVTNGSAVITSLSSAAGILTGLPITGTGIKAGSLVTSVDPIALTLTMSQAATATSTVTTTVAPTAFLTAGSNNITALSSLSGLTAGSAVTGVGIPANTVIGSVGGINTATLAIAGTNPPTPRNATITTATTVKSTPTAILQSGNNIVSAVFPITGATIPASGQLITDSQGNIPPGTTVTGVTASTFTITLSAPATGATTVTALQNFTGTVVASFETISSISPASVFTGTGALAIGQPISGTNIPGGTIITGVTASSLSITISQFPTAAAGATVTASSNPPAAFTTTTATTLTTFSLQNITVTSITPLEAVTIPTLVTVTPSLGTATLSQNATVTGTSALIVELPDQMDVQPFDPGTAAASAKGPTAIPGTTPTAYQGFFDTAGSSTSNANNPAGAVFARSFSQVLAALYGSTAIQTFQGGFFPSSVSGGINAV